MDDLIYRQAAIDAINKAFKRVFTWDGTSPLGEKVLKDVLSADAQPVVRCKDCKYRPYLPKECNPDESDGLDLVFPYDGKCPCECEDGWYSHIPEDDWFCANGKRKGEIE